MEGDTVETARQEPTFAFSFPVWLPLYTDGNGLAMCVKQSTDDDHLSIPIFTVDTQAVNWVQNNPGSKGAKAVQISSVIKLLGLMAVMESMGVSVFLLDPLPKHTNARAMSFAKFRKALTATIRSYPSILNALGN
jgi:hypothetical protein